MWTCVKCRQSVDDQYAGCPHCGAARSAGRFSRGVQPGQTPKADYSPEYARVRAGRGFLILGALLMLLIPAAVILIAVIGRKQWISDIYRFLYPSELGVETNSFKANLLYWLIAAVASLAGTLPGAWTIGIGKILRKLGRM